MWRFIVIAVGLIVAMPFVVSNLEKIGGTQADTNATATAGIDEDSSSGPSGRTHSIPISSRGHYIADVKINGRQLTMMVDTGATFLTLPEKNARKLGIFVQPSDFKIAMNTANGVAYAAKAEVRDFRIGPIRLKNIPAIVVKSEALKTPLLGMSVLNRLDRFDVTNDTLLLVQ